MQPGAATGCCKHEKNLPTEQNKAGSDTWLQGSNSHSRRACGIGCSTPKGQGTLERLRSTAALLSAAADSSRLTQLGDALAGRFEFPRRARLLSALDYERVFKRNKRVSNPYWTLLGHYRAGQSARMGLAIAKKRARRATDRNRLKRVARESFRIHQQELLGFDLVIMNKDSAAQTSMKTLRNSLDLLFADMLSQRPR